MEAIRLSRRTGTGRMHYVQANRQIKEKRTLKFAYSGGRRVLSLSGEGSFVKRCGGDLKIGTVQVQIEV